jgi:hypothetical protein
MSSLPRVRAQRGGMRAALPVADTCTSLTAPTACDKAALAARGGACPRSAAWGIDAHGRRAGRDGQAPIHALGVMLVERGPWGAWQLRGEIADD